MMKRSGHASSSNSKKFQPFSTKTPQPRITLEENEGNFISTLPYEVLFSIVSNISSVRTRNAVSLVSRQWRDVERSTRSRLVLRCHVDDLQYVPLAFPKVEDLDLSHCFPWASSIFISHENNLWHLQTALRKAFPLVKRLTLYSKCHLDSQLAFKIWPQLQDLVLVKWDHNFASYSQNEAPNVNLSLDLNLDSSLDSNSNEELQPMIPALSHFPILKTLDFSSFWCPSEVIFEGFRAIPPGSFKTLRCLDLLGENGEGFKGSEVEYIVQSWPYLQDLRLSCSMSPYLADSVGDETFSAIGSFCRDLKILHLADPSCGLGDPVPSVQPTYNQGQNGAEDSAQILERQESLLPIQSTITGRGLAVLFQSLPVLEEFRLKHPQPITECHLALQSLSVNCPNLHSLSLCNVDLASLADHPLRYTLGSLPVQRISLSSAPSLGFTELISLARVWGNLSHLELVSCPQISPDGIFLLAQTLKSSLRHVTVQWCGLPTKDLLQSLSPVQSSLCSLKIECLWDVPSSTTESTNESAESTWPKLESLFLWAPLGLPVFPLFSSGLALCPSLSHLEIQVEGSSDQVQRTCHLSFGLSLLSPTSFPSLASLAVDLRHVTGSAMTCRPGIVDLSIWERFYLHGIHQLYLRQLEYWPPVPDNVSGWPLSLLAAGMLTSGPHLRQLILHGDATVHFCQMLLRCTGLRDVKILKDFVPPGGESGVGSFRESLKISGRRFWESLMMKFFPD